MLLSLFQKICRPMFGSFEREDFKKFIRLGNIFLLILATDWTLRVLKNSIFMKLVSCDKQPYAKTLSVFCLFFLVIIYTKLLDRYDREKMFYILATFYSITLLLFAGIFLIVQAPHEIIIARTNWAWLGTKILGFTWYAYVESFGSLVIALFWAFTSDITSPNSAKKGFPFIVAFGQFGGIIAPHFLGGLPVWFSCTTDALPVACCGIMSFLIIFVVKHFFKTTPASLLTSYHGTNEKKLEQKQKPGFFEGLRLLVSQKYLLGIFAVLSFFEIIITIFDWNFQSLAVQTIGTGPELTQYLSLYASSVNVVALIFLLLGISNITRLLGAGLALILMPIIMGTALFGFLSFNSLTFLFWLMVCSKACNYVINSPVLKQLYIPTTHDVRFKAQAWIETFGSRGAKFIGAGFNAAHTPLIKSMGMVAGHARYLLLSGYFGAILIIGWFFTAFSLGRTYNKAIKENKLVC